MDTNEMQLNASILNSFNLTQLLSPFVNYSAAAATASRSSIALFENDDNSNQSTSSTNRLMLAVQPKMFVSNDFQMFSSKDNQTAAALVVANNNQHHQQQQQQQQLNLEDQGSIDFKENELDSIVNVTREYPFDYAIVMFGYLLPFVLIVTIVTNCLVVAVLYQRHMRTPTNIVLFTMAIVDLCTLLSPSPWYLYIYTFGNHNKFLYPPTLCYAHHMMTDVIPVFFHTSSIWLALLLASQRYIYVCHPTLARTWCTVPRVNKAIFWILLVAFAHQIPRFFDNTFESTTIQFNNVQHLACRNSIASWVETIQVPLYYTTYFTFRILFVFIIPCFALITLNLLLFRALKRAEHKRTQLLKTKFKIVDLDPSERISHQGGPFGASGTGPASTIGGANSLFGPTTACLLGDTILEGQTMDPIAATNSNANNNNNDNDKILNKVARDTNGASLDAGERSSRRGNCALARLPLNGAAGQTSSCGQVTRKPLDGHLKCNLRQCKESSNLPPPPPTPSIQRGIGANRTRGKQEQEEDNEQEEIMLEMETTTSASNCNATGAKNGDKFEEDALRVSSKKHFNVSCPRGNQKTDGHNSSVCEHRWQMCPDETTRSGASSESRSAFSASGVSGSASSRTSRSVSKGDEDDFCESACLECAAAYAKERQQDEEEDEQGQGQEHELEMEMEMEVEMELRRAAVAPNGCGGGRARNCRRCSATLVEDGTPLGGASGVSCENQAQQQQQTQQRCREINIEHQQAHSLQHQPISQCSSILGGATNTTTNEEEISSSYPATQNISSGSMFARADGTLDIIDDTAQDEVALVGAKGDTHNWRRELSTNEDENSELREENLELGRAYLDGEQVHLEASRATSLELDDCKEGDECARRGRLGSVANDCAAAKEDKKVEVRGMASSPGQETGSLKTSVSVESRLACGCLTTRTSALGRVLLLSKTKQTDKNEQSEQIEARAKRMIALPGGYSCSLIDKLDKKQKQKQMRDENTSDRQMTPTLDSNNKNKLATCVQNESEHSSCVEPKNVIEGKSTSLLLKFAKRQQTCQRGLPSLDSISKKCQLVRGPRQRRAAGQCQATLELNKNQQHPKITTTANTTATATATATTLFSAQTNSIGSLLQVNQHQAQTRKHKPQSASFTPTDTFRAPFSSGCATKTTTTSTGNSNSNRPGRGKQSLKGQPRGQRMKSPSFASCTTGRGSRATLVGSTAAPPPLFSSGGFQFHLSSTFNSNQQHLQQGNNFQANISSSSSRTMDSNRTTLMLVVVVTVFLIVEVPVALVTIAHVALNLFDIFRDVELSSCLEYIKLFTNFFIMISYSVNFTIYCSMSKKFRETFRDLFFCGRSAAERKRAKRILYLSQAQNSQYNPYTQINNEHVGPSATTADGAPGTFISQTMQMNSNNNNQGENNCAQQHARSARHSLGVALLTDNFVNAPASEKGEPLAQRIAI